MGPTASDYSPISAFAQRYGLSFEGIRLLLKAAGLEREIREHGEAVLSKPAVDRLDAYVAAIPHQTRSGGKLRRKRYAPLCQPPSLPRKAVRLEDRLAPTHEMLASLLQRFGDTGGVGPASELRSHPITAKPPTASQQRRQARKRTAKQKAVVKKLLETPSPSTYFGSIEPAYPDD